MRLAFWRAGRDMAVVQRALAKPAAAVASPAVAPSVRRSGFARAGPCLDAQAQLDRRPDGAGTRVVARRGEYGHPALQIRSAHPDRRARERVPAAERRPQRGAQRARCGSGNEPGAAAAVARSGAGDHQEEQACRAARIRSGAEGIFSAEIAAGVVRDRPRSVLVDAGRARAGSVFRALHRVCGGQIARHRHRIPVARSRTCRARRQLDRRRLSGAAAECAAGAGQGRGPMAVGRNRKSAQEGRGSRIPRRGFPLEVEPVHRHQQHLAVQSADG